MDFKDFTGVISIEIGDELIVVSCLSTAMTSHRKMCNDLSQNVPKLCNGNTHEWPTRMAHREVPSLASNGCGKPFCGRPYCLGIISDHFGLKFQAAYQQAVADSPHCLR